MNVVSVNFIRLYPSNSLPIQYDNVSNVTVGDNRIEFTSAHGVRVVSTLPYVRERSK